MVLAVAAVLRCFILVLPFAVRPNAETQGVNHSCRDESGPGSGAADAKRPFVTTRKTFRSPWTGCDKNGEGCDERMKEKEREWRALWSWLSWPVSFESSDVRHGVLVERRFFLPFFVPPCGIRSSERYTDADWSGDSINRLFLHA